MGKLDDKVALVTGAANGIAKTTAFLFAAEGAKVVCTDLALTEDEVKGNRALIPSAKPINLPRIYGETLGKVVAEIEAAGGTALGIQADVADEECLDNLLYETRRLFGPVDVLVNCAAINYFLPIVEMPPEFWKKSYDVMVHAPFMLSQKVLPAMMERQGGAIVNINSPAAAGPGRGPYKKNDGPPDPQKPPPDPTPLYGSAKAAVERFTQGLAAEVYGYGITVAAVGPSMPVITAGMGYMLGTKEGPPQSFTEPAEMMAKAILLLATEPLDKVTGRVSYSQAILKEFGWIEEGGGSGIDFPGSGYSQI